jgi:Flp pilus assembly pilin Flp
MWERASSVSRGERGNAQTEYILLAVLIALAVIAVILPR